MPGFTAECVSGSHAACTDSQCRCACHPWSHATVPQGQPSAAVQKVCPTCNKRTALTENFCRVDGTRLIQGVACKKCGSPMQQGDKYCWMCGVSREAEERREQIERNPKLSVEVQSAT
jgi:RNA polymerase subunit RPABC4/transcription elongation factor Spt4